MESEMGVAMVHPDNKEQVVIATHPQQVAALRSQGFVEVPQQQPAAKDGKGNR